MKILTFDIEDWFHILDNRSTQTYSELSNHSSRIAENIGLIFSLLEKYSVKATFFCLGWIAKKHPDLVRRIHSAGFEIGSHSFSHSLIYEQTTVRFSRDLKESLKILEDITGSRIRYFRAPGFSIREKNHWAFEILAENGIEYDSSLFPESKGNHRTFSGNSPWVIQGKGYEIKEFPVNTVTILGRQVVFSGGCYFRFLPAAFLKRKFSEEKYIMAYFHPGDFDPGQPQMENLNPVCKIKSYYGLKNTYRKFENILKNNIFTDIKTAAGMVDWEAARRVKI